MVHSGAYLRLLTLSLRMAKVPDRDSVFDSVKVICDKSNNSIVICADNCDLKL